MKVLSTDIDGVLLIKPDIFKDSRGIFLETYSESKYRAEGIREVFVQDNYSHSIKNTLRGLHYQLEHPQGKLVRVTKGSVLDYVLDIRKDSKTFGEHIMIELDDENFHQLYMPPGVAHGFFVKSQYADFEYKCTDYYFPEDQHGIQFLDPELNMEIPSKSLIMSTQDKSFLPLSRIKKNYLPG